MCLNLSVFSKKNCSNPLKIGRVAIPKIYYQTEGHVFSLIHFVGLGGSLISPVGPANKYLHSSLFSLFIP